MATEPEIALAISGQIAKLKEDGTIPYFATQSGRARIKKARHGILTIEVPMSSGHLVTIELGGAETENPDHGS